ncbi:MAG: hypothetical protein NZV14_07330 [Bryobacteraceae bacterium]|nr:hypothetical protein [Bryobacteraceae bacterium]MDW8377956.1 hypothetical protein [Bryobacterales bacterium]
MIPRLRRQFNERFTPDKYAAFLAAMDRRMRTHVGFRQCETPCFFPQKLLDRLAQLGRELVDQLLANSEYLRASSAIIPERYRAPGEAPYPMFVQADFGLVAKPSGEYEPRLVEIQGFPSLYCYQPALARQYVESYQLPSSLRFFFGDLNEESYRDLLARAILHGHSPQHVVLLEIEPEHQKTLADFHATEDLLGIPFVCIRKLRKEGRKLFYERNGRWIAIHRIYNRAIVDELERREVRPPFHFSDDLEVEWAGHPNWFFRLSKYSIPFLRHECVPRTQFLHEAEPLPPDLDNWVLKPLFSFAGLGVLIGPRREDIEKIPERERSQYILQERVDFTPVIETPHGPTKAEIRVMYVWLEEMTPVTTIIRMGRGKMMGVDHNKNMEWVGASAALYPPEE